MSGSGRDAAVDESQAPVRARRIYYLSGFDPRGAAFYHRLYREEAGKQARHWDARIEVGPRIRRGPHRHAWTVQADWQGESVSTDYHFLAWDDIVRRHWEPRLFRLFIACVAGYAGYIASGAFSRVRRGFRGPFISAVYPVFYVAMLLALATLGAAGAGWLAWGLGAGHALTAALAVLAAGVIGWAGMRLGNRIGVFWLLRTYLFVSLWGRRGSEPLERRVADFAEAIRRDQEEAPCDEVLLIGHSVGAIVAVALAARLARVLPAGQRGNFTLLTLGHCIPLISLMPTAAAIRRDLRTLAQAEDLRWLDMTARADALCFSQANPLEVSGIAAPGRPIALVVRPFRMFDARTYARLKRNKLRLHFQYLMASDLPNEYDYFRMTAGPGRLMPY